MIALVTGGSGSGKSAFAEKMAMELGQDGLRYYLATMQVYGEEGKKKVQRHRELRKDKGFLTIEQPCHVEKAVNQVDEKATILLECMSNLVANEMFQEQQMVKADRVEQKVLDSVLSLSQNSQNLVIVTNNVFEDGIIYDESTMAYIHALGKINQRLAYLSDQVVEVVAGIPVRIKKGV